MSGEMTGSDGEQILTCPDQQVTTGPCATGCSDKAATPAALTPPRATCPATGLSSPQSLSDPVLGSLGGQGHTHHAARGDLAGLTPPRHQQFPFAPASCHGGKDLGNQR